MKTTYRGTISYLPNPTHEQDRPVELTIEPVIEERGTYERYPGERDIRNSVRFPRGTAQLPDIRPSEGNVIMIGDDVYTRQAARELALRLMDLLTR